MISTHFNNHYIDYVKHKDLNGTKLILINIYSKTHFHELRNTVYLCRLQPNYDTECNKLTRMNFLRC